MSVTCYNCAAVLDYINVLEPLSRQEACPKCYRDLRVCKMCFFYDTHAYNDCREPSAERVTDKTKSNFCNFFKLNTVLADPTKNPNSREALMAKAMDLFKKN